MFYQGCKTTDCKYIDLGEGGKETTWNQTEDRTNN